jgi:hypothetical protein
MPGVWPRQPAHKDLLCTIAIHKVLQEKLLFHPVIQSWLMRRAYWRAPRQHCKTMLTTFPKVQFRIYEHAILVNVPLLLAIGSLLSGSSFFVEAFNKVWKNQQGL